MSATASRERSVLPQFNRIRELLELIGAIRDIQAPLTSADGLRQAIAVLVQLGQFVGIDASWILRLESTLTDDDLFQLMLAALRFAANRLAKDKVGSALHAAGDAESRSVVDSQGLIEWLPVIVQILQLLRQLRGAR